MRTLVLVSLMVVNTLASAATLPKSFGTKLAEVYFMSLQKSGNMDEWMANLGLTEDHQSEIRNYFKKNNVEPLAVPKMNWATGSSVIHFGSGSDAFTIDFAQFATKRTLLLNGKTVMIRAGASFEEIVAKFAAAERHTSAWWSVLVPSSYAVGVPHFGEITGATAYVFGYDKTRACSGQEANEYTLCSDKSEDYMMRLDLGANSTLTEFTCDGDKFQALGFQNTNGQIRLAVTHNPEVITVFQNGEEQCKYDASKNLPRGKGAIVGSPTPNQCWGRTVDEYESKPHELSWGSTPKSVAGVPIPLPRLKSCCKSDPCKTAMKAMIGKHGGPPAEGEALKAQ